MVSLNARTTEEEGQEKTVRRATWSHGWWHHASRRPCPNFGSRPPHVAVDLIVLHSISLPPGKYGGDSIERFFNNQLDWSAHPYFEEIRGLQVSSHFVIRRQGQVQQFVSCDQRAWHAGASAWRGRENCNDFSIGIELEGLEGQLFEPAQYGSLGNLLHALKRRYPIRAIAGHEHVAPGRKGDPGGGFDWAQLRHQLCWPRAYFPE
jgi:N-acetyl-anhydromuramoyl-L-alanine amidase